MSVTSVSFPPRNPLFGSRATPSNTGLHLFLAALLIFAAAEISFAEQLGAELLSTTIASSTLSKDADAPLDEIVVVGIRNEDGTVRPRRLLNDPLLQHILHDFEMRQELEREFEGRLETRDASDILPGVRLGYESNEQARDPEDKQAVELPLDLIRPAIVISFDF